MGKKKDKDDEDGDATKLRIAIVTKLQDTELPQNHSPQSSSHCSNTEN